MASDVVRPYSEAEKLRVQLNAALERLEDLQFDLKEARGVSALQYAVDHNQVWFARLTPKESMVMSLLCRAAPRVMTKRALMEGLYDAENEPAEKIVDVFVCKVRARIAPFGLKIETEWGRGYRISPDMARTWERWCAMTASGQVPPADFSIDPAQVAPRATMGRHWQDFCDQVDEVHGALETGEAVADIVQTTGIPVDFVRAVARGLAPAGSPVAAPDNVETLKPKGRTRAEVVEAAVAQTVAELGITLPYTARRAAEIAVDLMSAEVMAMVAEGEI